MSCHALLCVALLQAGCHWILPLGQGQDSRLPDGAPADNTVDAGPLSETGTPDGAPDAEEIPAGLCNEHGWCWENPRPQGNDLMDVHVDKTGVIFAVGRAGTILRCESPGKCDREKTGLSNDLYGLWVSQQGTDGIAVGDNGQVLRLTSKTSTWQAEIVPYLPSLRAVWDNGDDTVAAVGQSGVSAHYDGATWSTSSAAILNLHDVCGVDASSELIAVGDNGLVLSSNDGGLMWSSTSVGTQWWTVWSGAAGTFIAGANGEIRQRAAGGTWAKLEQMVTNSVLRGIWAGGTSPQIFAVGEKGTILRHDEKNGWQNDTPCPATNPPGNDDLMAISGFGNFVIAVGRSGTILTRPSTADCWFRRSYGATAAVYGVWGDVAVGQGGLVLQRMPPDSLGRRLWRPKKTSTNDDLHAVWGSGPTDVFGVGDNGTVLHFNGLTWTQQQTGAPVNLRGVWGTGPKDVFAVGDKGTIVHYDGIKWATIGTGTSVDLYAVWGMNAKDVYAVGDNGTVLHYDGVGWANWSNSVIGASNLRGVWGRSPTEVCVVGLARTLFRSDGATWVQDTSSADQDTDLLAVAGPNPSASPGGPIYVAGSQGALFELNPQSLTLSPLTPDTQHGFEGLWVDPSTGEVLAVGQGGMILRKSK